jgi:hypothetical protein
MGAVPLKRSHFISLFVFLVLWVTLRSSDRITTSRDTKQTHHGVVNVTSVINTSDTNTSITLGDATIVTAYFEFPSKHSSSDYVEWMQNMLSLQDPMIIFTTKDKEEMMYRMREHAINRTLVIVMKLEDAEVVRLYGMDLWMKQHELDPWHAIHPDPRLYIVWNEKISFVHKSIELNPFKSSYFLWMDIGFLRHSRYNGRRLVIDSTPFAENRVLTLDITQMSANFFYDRFTTNENKICGNLFGGTIAGMERYHSEYYKTLATDLNNSRFVGVDQIVMWRTCQRESSLCNVVTVNPTCGEAWRFCYRVQRHLHRIVNWSFLTNDPDDQDPWFYFVPFLLDRLWVKHDH